MPSHWSEEKRVFVGVLNLGPEAEIFGRIQEMKNNISENDQGPKEHQEYKSFCPISFLWKTHKDFQDTPPTRPLCDASNGPTARNSDLLSRILTLLMEMRESTVMLLHYAGKFYQLVRELPLVFFHDK